MRSVLLVVLVAAVAACSAPVPTGSTPATVTGPTVVPTTGSAAVATSTITVPSQLPTDSPGPTPTAPEPTTGGGPPDDMIALSVARQYMDDLVAGRYTRAWQLLSAQAQQQAGSLTAFTAERSAFFASAGTRFSMLKPHTSEAELAQWLPQDFDGQRARAFAITVRYPKLAGNNAGTAVLVAAPDGNGDWRIWVAR